MWLGLLILSAPLSASLAPAGAETMPDLGPIPAGRVLLQLSEGLPDHKGWPSQHDPALTESVRWHQAAFLLPRIPLHYDHGIRSAWDAPLLLRMAADVDLPLGFHDVLVRSRGLGRLWVDGQVVAETGPLVGRPPDGEEPVTPLAEPPQPGLRPHGYHQQEVIGEVEVVAEKSGSHPRVRSSRIVWEVIVGGPGNRTESGEVCVGFDTTDGSTFELLGAGSERFPLTDCAVGPLLVEIERGLDQLDDRRRRETASSENEYWERRHRHARDWVLAHDVPEVPSADGARTAHPIDAFIQAKIEQHHAGPTSNPKPASAAHSKVLPTLREHCLRCHGGKSRGGLRLDSRVAILKAGDSGFPAVVPGDPEGSELIIRIREEDEFSRMPPAGPGLDKDQIKVLEDWILDGAEWPEERESSGSESANQAVPVIGDAAFLRRVYLDTIGLPPGEGAIRAFLVDETADKRNRVIDDLLEDDRLADHWMSFWLDLLAENPSLLNASLNSTGPFRWFLYDSLRDGKPLDRMVTELIMLRGGVAEGGSAGFGLAGENDAPFAAKGHIVASAFQGIELQCARCHDSPYHSTTQRDLYSLAAMFDRKPATVPKSSRVPVAFFEAIRDREPLIQVTLRPDEPVEPTWPFGGVTGAVEGPGLDRFLRDPGDTRERLAALITMPENRRFARVFANRIWSRLLGAGLVEPIHDWEGVEPSHPELLDWLANELVLNKYDFRAVLRTILTSTLYQREAHATNRGEPSASRLFRSPDRRRLTAEQVVDALHVASGRPIDSEKLTFVHDGRRPLNKRQTLERPTRAWMFADLKNERDRPSLSLPKARAVVEVLEAFGWTGARQAPIHERGANPNLLQPGILANGTLVFSLTRASAGSTLAQLAVQAESPNALVESLFLRFLGRFPNEIERQGFVDALAEGFDDRLMPADQRVPVVGPPTPLPLVTWFNHLSPEANEIQLEHERRVRAGPPADPRIRPSWREVFEDLAWSLVNHREFVWIP